MPELKIGKHYPRLGRLAAIGIINLTFPDGPGGWYVFVGERGTTTLIPADIIKELVPNA